MIIITKVENNRVGMYLPVTIENADRELQRVVTDYPDAFIYNGEFEDELWVENKVVTKVPLPSQVPNLISMRQARLALLQSGLLATVDAAIAQGTEADKITWEYATEVYRNDALVANLSVVLGLSSKQLDDLFLLASSL